MSGKRARKDRKTDPVKMARNARRQAVIDERIAKEREYQEWWDGLSEDEREEILERERARRKSGMMRARIMIASAMMLGAGRRF